MNLKLKILSLLREAFEHTKVTHRDLFKVTAILANANQKFNKIPYFQDVYEGDGKYMVKVYPDGKMQVASAQRDADAGTMKDDKRGGVRYLYVMAYRGISHPEYDDDTRMGYVIGKSPAQDAMIKAMVIFPKEIIEWVKMNIEGETAYTADVTTDKQNTFKQQTPDKFQYKYDKFEKEKQRKANKPVISASPEEIKAYEDKQKELLAKRQNYLKRLRGESVNLTEAVGDYSKWKRNNVTYRGIKEMGQENNVHGSLGKGLYTTPATNKSMAKTYGNLYFVVNARPKNPKQFNGLNEWEIWFYKNLVTPYSKAKGKEFPDKRDFNASTTIEAEMLKLGFDGIEIKGREMVNYTPQNILYFKNELQLKNYFDQL